MQRWLLPCLATFFCRNHQSKFSESCKRPAALTYVSSVSSSGANDPGSTNPYRHKTGVSCLRTWPTKEDPRNPSQYPLTSSPIHPSVGLLRLFKGSGLVENSGLVTALSKFEKFTLVPSAEFFPLEAEDVCAHVLAMDRAKNKQRPPG